MFVKISKILVCNIFAILCFNSILLSPVSAQDDVDKSAEKTEPSVPLKALELFIETKAQICRARSPISISVYFKNISDKPQKLCIYKLHESLLKLDFRKAGEKKYNFDPILVKARPIKQDDWIKLKPGRVYKTAFSLGRMYLDKTGSRLNPGSYFLKINYDGCYKFDTTLPETFLESNILYLMVTD